MAGGVVGLVYAANIEKVSERKPGERDWCHMAPLISATLNPSLSMQSQTSNLSHQVADQHQQFKQSCKQRLTVKGEYAAETKYTAFSPVWPFAFSFWASRSKHLNISTIYLNICIFGLPALTSTSTSTSVHLRFLSVYNVHVHVLYMPILIINTNTV